MKETQKQIQELLGTHLESKDLELVDLIEIPQKADRMMRIRTLEEALDDFDAPAGTDTVGFLVQVRTRNGAVAAKEVFEISDLPTTEENSLYRELTEETLKTSRQDDSAAEPIYRNDGKLNVEYLLSNADLLFSAADYSLAANIYQAILQSGERAGAALYGLGRCREIEGKPEAALKLYEESIAYLPQLDAFERLGALLIRARKDQEAAEVLERALMLPDLTSNVKIELLRTAGNCWMRADKVEKAREQYQKAIVLDPQSDAVTTSLGALELQAGRTEEARRCFDRALQINGKNDKAIAGLGSVAFANGDYRSAHDHLARALDLNLQQPTLLVQLVKCSYEIKSYATAARIVADYVDSAPINAHLLYCLAGLRFQLGRMDDARSTLDRLLSIQPEHSGAKDLLRRIERI